MSAQKITDYQVVEDYQVVKGKDLVLLTYLVKSEIDKGWQPLGGILLAMIVRTSTYYQAMVKYEGDEEED